MTVADRALEYIRDGMVVGLGTGRAATTFVHALGEKVKAGLNVRGVPTSAASEDLARSLGIPLTTLDEVDTIDVAVDGADEVDPQLNLIKGLGGALVREKVVASAAKLFLVVVGAEKLVERLGARGKLPVEVVPFAVGYCRRRLAAMGMDASPRMAGGGLYHSDNLNDILDAHVAAIDDPPALDLALRAIPGVVGTGLFLGMAHAVLVQDGEGVRVLGRP